MRGEKSVAILRMASPTRAARTVSGLRGRTNLRLASLHEQVPFSDLKCTPPDCVT